MRREPRWARCIRHRGLEACDFLRDLLREKHRHVLLVAGAGFDPRSPVVAEFVSSVAADRVRALFLKEERPRANIQHAEWAERNLRRMEAALPDNANLTVKVFASGSMAVTGGREAVRALESYGLHDATDVLLDVSALSIGVAFPLARHLLEQLATMSPAVNLHLVLVDSPEIDHATRAVASDAMEVMAGFKGGLGLDANAAAAKLWLPQLASGQLAMLSRIRTSLAPDGVAPILPFPSENPRLGDLLIEEYTDQFESEWQVQAQDVIYASEALPLDLYRTILQIGDKRQRVFEQVGGSLIVLSPIGGKVPAIGAMLAAIERDLPIVYVEPIGFITDAAALALAHEAPRSLIHLWLCGEADPYPSSGPTS